MDRQSTVLVVEDDVEMNELERELLEAHGIDSVPAYSGTEALELCKIHSADGVLLDLMLPELDGFETCARLRTEAGDSPLAIVIVSALDSEESRRKGMEAGADAYFSKPFDPDEVIATLRRLMASDRAASE